MKFELIKNIVPLNWDDISWGYHKQLLGWKDVVDYANNIVINGSDNEYIFELSMINHSNLSELNDLLAKLGNPLINYDNSKWLYILLLQLFNNRNNIADALGEVEKIYEEFDYPEEIKSFVRYMPASDNYDPSKHTLEENKRRLYFHWEQYLINNKFNHQVQHF